MRTLKRQFQQLRQLMRDGVLDVLTFDSTNSPLIKTTLYLDGDLWTQCRPDLVDAAAVAEHAASLSAQLSSTLRVLKTLRYSAWIAGAISAAASWALLAGVLAGVPTGGSLRVLQAGDWLICAASLTGGWLSVVLARHLIHWRLSRWTAD